MGTFSIPSGIRFRSLIAVVILPWMAPSAVKADPLGSTRKTEVGVIGGVTDRGPGAGFTLKSENLSSGYLSLFLGRNDGTGDLYLRLKEGFEIEKGRVQFRSGNFQYGILSQEGQFTFNNLNSCDSAGSNKGNCVRSDSDMKNAYADLLKAAANLKSSPHSNPTMNPLSPFAGNGHILVGVLPMNFTVGGVHGQGTKKEMTGFIRGGVTPLEFGVAMDPDALAPVLDFAALLRARGSITLNEKHEISIEGQGTYRLNWANLLPNVFQSNVIPKKDGSNLGDVAGSGIGVYVGKTASDHLGSVNGCAQYTYHRKLGQSLSAGVCGEAVFMNVKAAESAQQDHPDAFSGNSYSVGAVLNGTFAR